MKKIFLIFLGLFILSSITNAQDDPDERARNKNNLLSTYPMENTTKIQNYYQNLFESKGEEKQNKLFPSYDIDKDKLIDKLREAIPLQGPIDIDNYLVGPGDIFDVTIIGNLPNSLVVQITPEGSLVIPTIGVVDVKNMYLVDAKQKVESFISSQFKNSKVTLTLVSPRIFSVSVSGVVNNPGNFYASSVQRVDEVIYMANLKANLAISEVSKVQTKERELLNKPEVIKYFRTDEQTEQELKMSLRNIKVVRLNGDTLNVDLVRYYATGDVKYNPFLHGGDRIYVPNESLTNNSITISGEVRIEGEYEYSPYDSVSSVLAISQGPTEQADLANVEVYRTNFEKGGMTKLIVDFKKLMSNKQLDIPLQPNDRIIFRSKYPREQALSVTIKGEVVSPGLYPIERNNTTIKDVIDFAGGFTKYASLSEAKIIRFTENLDEAEKNPDYARLSEMRLTDMDQRKREYYNFESSIRRGFVAVDFEELFENGNENYNLKLQDGDVIIVPEKQYTIYVFGQVVKDGYYDYIPGKDYQYYIDLAGGVSEMGLASYTRIIKAGTQNWLEPDETKLETGDAIWVPRDWDSDELTFAWWFSWVSRGVAFLAGIATIILVANSTK